MLKNEENKIIIDAACFKNQESKNNYIARLRWLCYSHAMKQIQTIILYCEAVERMIALYTKGIEDYTNTNNEQMQIDFEKVLATKLVDRLKGETTPNQKEQENLELIIPLLVQAVAEKESNIKNDIIPVYRELQTAMEQYNPSQWADINFEVESNSKAIQWQNFKPIIIAAKFLEVLLKASIAMDYQTITDKKTEQAQKDIALYGNILANKWLKDKLIYDQNYEELLEEIEDKSIIAVLNKLDEFYPTKFKAAINSLTGNNNTIYNISKQPTADMQKTHTGKGLPLWALEEIINKLGYNVKEIQHTVAGEYILPAFVALSEQELFTRIFPIIPLQCERDLLPLVHTDYYKQRWYGLENDTFLNAVLKVPYSDNEYTPIINNINAWLFFSSILTIEQLEMAGHLPEKDEYMEEPEDEAFVEDYEQAKEAFEDYLKDYDRIKEQLKKLAEEYPELGERLVP